MAALAEACWRAFRADRRRGLARATSTAASAWFLGDNDAAWPLYDDVLGRQASTGCTPHGVNQNQGAESTLAALSTLQLGRLALVQAVA